MVKNNLNIYYRNPMNTFTDSLGVAYLLILTPDSALWSIVLRSLSVSGLSILVSAPFAIIFGALIACSSFKLKPLVELVLNAMLAMPSVVLGLVVYLILSRSGPLGHLGWLFSMKAMVLAQSLLIFPLMMALANQAVKSPEMDVQEQLKAMGAGVLARAMVLIWDCREAMLLVMVAGFSRAIAEVGAVMIVGGNIDGFTRVMTTAIALETSKGDLALALALGIILLTIVFLLHALMSWFKTWHPALAEA